MILLDTDTISSPSGLSGSVDLYVCGSQSASEFDPPICTSLLLLLLQQRGVQRAYREPVQHLINGGTQQRRFDNSSTAEPPSKRDALSTNFSLHALIHDTIRHGRRFPLPNEQESSPKAAALMPKGWNARPKADSGGGALGRGIEPFPAARSRGAP